MNQPGLKTAMLLGVISFSPFFALGMVDAPKRLTAVQKVEARCQSNPNIESVAVTRFDGSVKTYNCKEYRS